MFIVSAAKLKLFVATINKKEHRKAISLIDEERFMTALIEGVVNKRNYLQKLEKSEERKRRKQEKNNKQTISNTSNTSNISADSMT